MIQFTARPETMRTIVDVLSVIVDEARMRFSSDGLDINVVDASHVALIMQPHLKHGMSRTQSLQLNFQNYVIYSN